MQRSLLKVKYDIKKLSDKVESDRNILYKTEINFDYS